MNFLEHIVDTLPEDRLTDLKSHCFVFPTQRGRLFFKQALIRKWGHRDFFLPAMLSIEDFIVDLTGKAITDELTLLFELYQHYKKRESTLEFDRFYAWGRVILKDFDEIDRYLGDASTLYKSLQDLKTLESAFALDDEIREIVAHFRSVTDRKDKTRLLTEFLKVWEAVGQVYHEFRKGLLEKGMHYAGMLYRLLAESIREPAFDHPYAYYHMCGFNALSSAEEFIFDTLYQTGKAQLYWDADPLYLDDPREEAGNFLRAYRAKWPDTQWIISESLQSDKRVEVAGVPQYMGQVHAASHLLEEGIRSGWKAEETAIVLADEKLLLPLLYALPDHDIKVNVTMGYPMRYTAAYDFLESYLELYRRAIPGPEEVLVYASDLKRLIASAYLSIAEPGIYEKLSQWLVREKKHKLTLTMLREQVDSKEVQMLFSQVPDWKALFRAVQQFLTPVFYHFKQEEQNAVDKELIYAFLKALKVIFEYLDRQKETISLKLIKKLVQEHFRSGKVPFEGEPVEGFQVMGFLETRTLDFKHVIVVSANEGVLPAKRSAGTYIPFALRKAYGLPTFEEQDAIYAYHFKRLTQRAEDLHFIYNNEVTDSASGECSRFVRQLFTRYRSSEKIVWKERPYSGKLKVSASEPEAITIDKSEAVLAMMDRYLTSTDPGRFLSPTSLTTYIICPLRFYFQYTLRIRESEVLEEDIDARNFGIVVHRVLELIYEPFIGQTLDAVQIRGLERKVSKYVSDTLIEKKVIQKHQELEGKDVISGKIIERLVSKILSIDQQEAPFYLIGLEKSNWQHVIALDGERAVRLGGAIDRIDKKDGAVRVIDYKTGKVALPAPAALKRPWPDYLDLYFNDPAYKSGFQGYLYGVLARAGLGDVPLKIGILGMRAINRGVQWLRQGEVLSKGLLDAFTDRLEHMVRKIYDPRVPFTQTDDPKRCVQCPYNRICNRV